MPERLVIRCSDCQLVQYPTLNGSCRRCRKQLRRVPVKQICKEVPQALVESKRNSVELVETIGHTIKSVRIARGISQGIAADRIHMSRSYLCRIEDNQMSPSMGKLEKIALGLGVSVEVLLGTKKLAYPCLYDDWALEVFEICRWQSQDFKKEVLVAMERMIDDMETRRNVARKYHGRQVQSGEETLGQGRVEDQQRTVLHEGSNN